MHVDIVAVTNTLVLEKGPIGKNLFDCFYDAFEAKGMSHRLQSLHDWEQSGKFTDIGDRECFIPLSILKLEITCNISWRVFRSFFSHFLEVAFSSYGSYPLTYRSFFLIQVRFQLHSLSCRYPVFLAQFSEWTFLHCIVLVGIYAGVYFRVFSFVLLAHVLAHVSRLMPVSHRPDYTL